MKVFNHTVHGLKQGFKFKRLALYILLIQLSLSASIGILSFNYIQKSIGDSTNLYKIIEGYDHDVFQDLLRFESTGWSMIKVFILVVVLLYLLLGPLILGGILNVYRKNQDNWINFWVGGSKYYLSFLKINLIITTIALAILILFLMLAVFITNYGFNNFLTEIPTLVTWVFLLLIFILVLIILVSISTNAKWRLMNKKGKIWFNFKKASTEVFGRLWSFLFLGFIFLLITAIFTFLVNFIINCIPESGFALVFLAILLQLFALYIRVCLRNSYYSALIEE